MKLNSRTLGSAGQPPAIVLHGLLGSVRNWGTAARRLGERLEVHVLDLRNHGGSPHDPSATFAEMAADVLEYLDDHGIDRPLLLGHSLGGKVAMRFAASFAGRVAELLVLDIAPKRYPIDPQVLDALLSLETGQLSSRGEANEQLSALIPDEPTRLFALTNLVRDGEGFRWQANLEVLRSHLEEWSESPLSVGETFDGPTLFLAGGASGYVSSNDLGAIRAHFPQAKLQFLEGVGHNVHVEGGDAFFEAVLGS